MSSTFLPPRLETVGAPVAPDWARIRYALLAVFAVVAIAILALGNRPASFFELTKDIQDGKVTQVTVVNALPPGATGYTQAEIHWHDGVTPRYTPVLHVVPSDETGVTTYQGPAREQITGDIGARLNEYSSQPLTVTRAADSSAGTSVVVGWQVPNWVGILAIVASLGTIALLVFGPQPLMATKWAWFWALASVVGFAATPIFLLWGIPRTGAIEQPYSKQGRLTGGWAFLLFSVLASSLLPGLRPW